MYFVPRKLDFGIPETSFVVFKNKNRKQDYYNENLSICLKVPNDGACRICLGSEKKKIRNCGCADHYNERKKVYVCICLEEDSL